MSAGKQDLVFWFSTPDATKFRTLISTFNSLLSENVIVFTKDGFSITGRNNTVFLKADIKASAANTSYKYDHNQDKLNIGISFRELFARISQVSQADQIELFATKASLGSVKPHLFVRYSPDSFAFYVENTIKLISLDSDVLEHPHPSPEYTCSISCSLMQKHIRAASKFSTKMQVFLRPLKNHNAIAMRFLSDAGVQDLFFKLNTLTRGEDNKKSDDLIKFEDEQTFCVQTVNAISTKQSGLGPNLELFLSAGKPLGLRFNIGLIGDVSYYIDGEITTVKKELIETKAGAERARVGMKRSSSEAWPTITATTKEKKLKRPVKKKKKKTPAQATETGGEQDRASAAPASVLSTSC